MPAHRQPKHRPPHNRARLRPTTGSTGHCSARKLRPALQAARQPPRPRHAVFALAAQGPSRHRHRPLHGLWLVRGCVRAACAVAAGVAAATAVAWRVAEASAAGRCGLGTQAVSAARRERLHGMRAVCRALPVRCDPHGAHAGDGERARSRLTAALPAAGSARSTWGARPRATWRDRFPKPCLFKNDSYRRLLNKRWNPKRLKISIKHSAATRGVGQRPHRDAAQAHPRATGAVVSSALSNCRGFPHA